MKDQTDTPKAIRAFGAIVMLLLTTVYGLISLTGPSQVEIRRNLHVTQVN